MAAEECYSFLHPGHAEKHRRARNWTDSEMKTLLQLWEEYYHELRKSKRNARIYEKMSQTFFTMTGEHRHKEEMKMKITNMSFQYRRLKCTTPDGVTPDWPYFKAIDDIFTKTKQEPRGSENGPSSAALGLQSPGPSTSSLTTTMGFLQEYTGSSEEMEMKEEEEQDFSVTSGSVHSLESSVHVTQGKRRMERGTKQQSLRRRKLRVMEAMLKEQRKMAQAVEETCREVRRAVNQQNLLQVQSLQLQDRMMNLLEKMIQPAWGKDPGKG